MGRELTPTEKAIERLIELGYEMNAKITDIGGSDFIWIFKRPDGTIFVACKTKTLLKEISIIQ
ncbi:hypothetical protein LCGC14_0431040 [marine sediment metagenome]|uniref:Uncharacterized protein n=1 Tax=marine sediment metagenome TaxID=412755 RepID=A0A0F9SU91_9ZZZZ